MTNISGINEDGIDKLILDIYNCHENIHKELEKIYENIEKTEVIFKSNLSNKMRYKFDNNKIKIDNTFYKLENYIDILLKVKNKYQELNTEITNKFNKEEIRGEII